MALQHAVVFFSCLLSLQQYQFKWSPYFINWKYKHVLILLYVQGQLHLKTNVDLLYSVRVFLIAGVSDQNFASLWFI